MFSGNVDMYGPAPETDWPGPGFTVPRDFIALKKALKNGNITLLGRGPSGRKQTLSATRYALEDPSSGYEKAVLTHVLHHLASKRGLTEEPEYRALASDLPRLEVEDEGDDEATAGGAGSTPATKVEEDERPRTRSTTRREEARARGGLAQRATGPTTADLAMAKAVFIEKPFAPTDAGEVESLTQAAMAILTFHRRLYDAELVYHFEKVITPALRAKLAHRYAMEGTLRWADVKKVACENTEETSARAGLVELLCEVRATGATLTQWVLRIDAIARKVRLSLNIDEDDNAGFRTITRGAILSQTTAREKTLLELPTEPEALAALNVQAIITKTAKIDAALLPKYKQMSKTRLEGVVLFAEAPETSKKEGSKDEESSKRTSKKNSKSTGTKGGTPKPDDGRKAKLPEICPLCKEKHAFGEHILKGDKLATRRAEYKREKEERRRSKRQGEGNANGKGGAYKDAEKSLKSMAARAATYASRVKHNLCCICASKGHATSECPKTRTEDHDKVAMLATELAAISSAPASKNAVCIVATVRAPKALAAVTKDRGSDIMTATGTYIDAHGIHVKQKTLLDTCAAFSLADPRLLRAAPPGSMPPLRVQGLTGHTTQLPPPGILMVAHAKGSANAIYAYPADAAYNTALPDGATVLLGKQALQQLGVSTDAYLHGEHATSEYITRASHRMERAPTYLDSIAETARGTPGNGDARVRAATPATTQQALVAETPEAPRTPEGARPTSDRPALLEICAGSATLSHVVANRLQLPVMAPVDIIYGDDLTDRATASALLREVRNCKPSIIWLAPPCAAFSQAQRFTQKKYAPSRRSREEQQTLQILRLLQPIVAAVAQYGGDVIIEQPEHSTLPATREWTALVAPFTDKGRPMSATTHDRCEFGGQFKKPTTLHTSFRLDASDGLAKRCSHADPHTPLRGAKTKETAAYTQGQAHAFANVIRRRHLAIADSVLDETSPAPTRGGETADAIPPPAWVVRSETPFNGCCFLSQALLRRYLSFRDTLAKKERQSWQDIRIHEQVPKEHKARFEALHREYAEVFAIDPEKSPRPAKAEPIEFKFKPGRRYPRTPEPRWTPAEEAVLKPWADRMIRTGAYEHAPDARYASRLHIALKQIAGEPKDLSGRFDIRICHDLARANDAIEKAVANYPDPRAAIEKAAGHIAYISTDAHAQFNIFRVAAGETRESMTVWAPGHGKICPRRLIFGTINGSTYAQHFFKKYEAALDEDTRRNKVMFQDDSCIFAGKPEEGLSDRTWEALLRRWKDYLEMCRKYHVTLKPSKTTVGAPECKFYGHIVSADGHRQTVKNAEPIRNCRPPQNVSELRAVLGLFNVGRSRVPHFATIAKPMTDLLKKGVPFDFGAPAKKAFQTLKAALSDRPLLSAPDFKRPFFLDTDASDEGAGAFIYQEDAAGQRLPIEYHSKKWSASMRHRPVYYREAGALFYGIEKARRYARMSPHPLTCRVDQASLQWVKHSEKGLVNSWRIHHAADVDYRIEYIQGSKNVVADALSRFPMVGPRTLNAEGLYHATTELLQRLESLRGKRINVYAQADTAELARLLRDLSQPKRVTTTKPRTSQEGQPSEPEADIQIVVPTPVEAVVTLIQLLKRKEQIAVLIPSDLLRFVKDDPEAAAQLKKTRKITFLNTTLTWVVRAEGITQDVILMATRASIDPSKAATKPDGTVLYQVDEDTVRQYVPQAARRALIKRAHDSLHHLGPAKTIAELQRSYYWPSLSVDVRTALKACAICARSKARRNRAHGSYRPDKPRPVRTRWGLDFFSHPAGPVLTTIDLDAGYVIFKLLPSRAAKEVIKFVRDCIIYTFGTPTTIVSDDAKEFIGKEFQEFLSHHTITHKRSFGYHPEANAKCERSHAMLNAGFRAARDEEYRNPQGLLSKMAFAINNTPSRTTGVAPHELFFGTCLRSSTDPQIPVEAPEIPHAPLTQDAVAEVKERITAHTVVASAARAYETRAQAARLNAGRKPASFKKGDRVLAYVPPMVRTARSKKHLMSWEGPCIVVAEFDGHVYQVEHVDGRRRWTRSIANLRPWRGDPSDKLFAAPTRNITTSTLRVGEVIAVLDDPDDRKYHIARVLSLADNEARVHYYGTRSKVLATAKWVKTYADRQDRILLHTPRREERATKYTGIVPVVQDLVLARNLRLRPNQQLTFSSTQLLASLRQVHFSY